MPGPLARYRTGIERGQWIEDVAQARAAQALDELFGALQQASRRRWWQRKRTTPPQGIYLVGPVGRGKTFLMDLLVESLQETGLGVQRMHFHSFMAQVQDQLQALDGQPNPLVTVAQTWAQTIQVLCFDEFHVDDIADAMILGDLLESLFQHQVVLVATSNTEPDDLYHDGLQRARFLPAIEQIKSHTQLIHLDTPTDYRLRALTQAPTYFYPLTDAHYEQIKERFETLTGQIAEPQSLTIQGREINTLGVHGSVAWFDFSTLCQTHRSSRDYIELVQRFTTLLISGLPQLSDEDNDAARRLIHLIDEAYDHRIKLIVTAAMPAHEIYTGQRLSAAFERASSRLIEMQSKDYLAEAKR